MLFASTAINYIDRQTLSLLAPYLKVQYGWSNSDYADIVIAFRIAYSVGQTVFGWLMDRIGTRRGLTLSVAWYSVVSAATSLANGFFGFALCRFCLGAGESANWPAASKAVSSGFPSGSDRWRRRSSIVVPRLAARWRPLSCCLSISLGCPAGILGSRRLGCLWLVVWRRLYHPPTEHPRISEDELLLIQSDKIEDSAATALPRPRWSRLLTLRETWAPLARTFTDPVWFFVTDWFPIYLVAKGIELKSGLIAVWIPFLAADLGNLCAGGLSGYLIKRGWSLGAARKALVIFGGLGVTLLIPTIFTSNLYVIAGLFAVATFSYASFLRWPMSCRRTSSLASRLPR